MSETSALELSLQGFDPERATRIAAIENGESDGCTVADTGTPEALDEVTGDVVSADELAELDAPE